MDNPFFQLGAFIFISFVYLDRVLARWKKEQDEKLSEIQDTLNDLKNGNRNDEY